MYEHQTNPARSPSSHGCHRKKFWILLFFSKMHFHHGYSGKMKQLTPKGSDAQEVGGCCGIRRTTIPCDLAQAHSQPSQHDPCRRLSGNEGFEGKSGAHLIGLRKGLPTGNLSLALLSHTPHP